MYTTGIPETPHTSNLLQFVMSQVLASDGNSKTVKPVLSTVYESVLRNGSDRGIACQSSASGDRHQPGNDQRHVVEGQREA